MAPFADALLKNVPIVREVKSSFWHKTHKNGTPVVGGQGNPSLSRNCEFGLNVYLGQEGSTVVAAHFPFFTKSTKKEKIDLMNRLRTQMFFCPFATDLEKYKHPADKSVPLNIYDKGTHFNDFMVNTLYLVLHDHNNTH